MQEILIAIALSDLCITQATKNFDSSHVTAKTNCTKAVVDMKNNQVTIMVNGDEIRVDQLGNVGDKTSPCFFNICTTLCCLCYLLMQM